MTGSSAHPPSDESAPLTARVSGELMDAPYRRTFVGRVQELRQLQAAFDAATAGKGSLVLVTGEPGMGKTALCNQLCEYATSHGGRVLVGHCYEEAFLSLPYAPFVEILQEYVRARPAPELAHDMGQGAAELARIVPELRDRLGVVAPRPTDPEQDKWQLFSALLYFLRSAVAQAPLVLLLEDLHSADRGSLDVLMFLARHLAGARLLIVGTYRDVEVHRGHPLSGVLAELRRGDAYDRVLLRGLPAPDVRTMVSSLARRDVSQDFAKAMHDQTEGNPLFVQEVVRYLVEADLLERVRDIRGSTSVLPATLALPEGLREVIGKRLNGLSQACNQALGIAAVVGREFDLSTLQAVAAFDEESLVTALDQARRVGVLEERAALGRVRYRFAHALIRQTLYEELSAARRLQLHQRVARTLEHQYAAQLEEHAAELADHFAQSTDREDLVKATRYAELAASRASAVFAYGEAVRQLDRALEVQDALDPGDAGRRCDLLLLMGDALLATGEFKRIMEEIAPAAFELAEKLADRGRASRACALGLLALRFNARVGQSPGLATLTPIGRLWAGRADRYALPESRERALADFALATIERADGRRAEARQLYYHALSEARQSGDPDTLAWAFGAVLVYCTAVDDQPQRLALAEEASRLSLERVTSMSAWRMLHGCSSAFLTWSDRARAEEMWQAIGQLVGRTRGAGAPSISTDHLAYQLALLDGDIDLAARLAAGYVASAQQAGRSTAGPTRSRTQGTLVPLLLLGRADEALAEADRLGQEPEALMIADCHRALCLAHMGRTDEARAVVGSVIRRERIDEADYYAPLAVLVELLEAATLCRDADSVRLLTGRLAPVSQLLVPALSTVPPVVTTVARHLGAALALLGERDQARVHTDQALALAEKVRFRPEAALARVQLGELLVDSETTQQLGLEHLQTAVEALRAMNMQPALQRALDLVDRVERMRAANTRPAKPMAGGLTNREQEVAALLAGGLSNRSIAQTLVISESTAEVHVKRILSKLGFTSRAQVAVWAAQQGFPSRAEGRH